ncbi:hypothetical protein AB6849_18445 [Serratia proteamaculans]|uniref:hypothetical protein n=1 Tax=Serratia proteamaculans TaxID=28151 RepID=UPI001C56071E|nr:hypothetical protein [Serratia proteamaculans]WEO91516.1 hypothetical protein JET59_010085 [Serratia proteamaculans]
MSNKNEAINAVNRAIGFIRGNAHHELSNTFVKELIGAINFMENTAQHEEYKAAWLSLVNTIHSIEPEWLEKYSGESEWQKACAFITDQNQALKKATDEIGGWTCNFIDVDFAASVSDDVCRQFMEDFRTGHTNSIFASHTHNQPVYFRDLLRSVAITQIKEELAVAEKKHPTWPTDTVHATAILNEEAGELTQAAIDYHYHNGSLEKVRREAAQVGAMAIRVLINLPYAERPAASEKKVTGAAR